MCFTIRLVPALSYCVLEWGGKRGGLRPDPVLQHGEMSISDLTVSFIFIIFFLVAAVLSEANWMVFKAGYSVQVRRR